MAHTNTFNTKFRDAWLNLKFTETVPETVFSISNVDSELIFQVAP